MPSPQERRPRRPDRSRPRLGPAPGWRPGPAGPARRRGGGAVGLASLRRQPCSDAAADAFLAADFFAVVALLVDPLATLSSLASRRAMSSLVAIPREWSWSWTWARTRAPTAS